MYNVALILFPQLMLCVRTENKLKGPRNRISIQTRIRVPHSKCDLGSPCGFFLAPPQSMSSYCSLMDIALQCKRDCELLSSTSAWQLGLAQTSIINGRSLNPTPTTSKQNTVSAVFSFGPRCSDAFHFKETRWSTDLLNYNDAPDFP